MTGLPNSLAIALWATVALWVVGVIAYLLESPPELVAIVAIAGVVAAVTEWTLRNTKG